MFPPKADLAVPPEILTLFAPAGESAGLQAGLQQGVLNFPDEFDDQQPWTAWFRFQQCQSVKLRLIRYD